MPVPLSTRILLKRIDLWGQPIIVIIICGLFANNSVQALIDWKNQTWSILLLAMAGHSIWQIMNSAVHFFIYKNAEKSNGRYVYERYLLACLILFALMLIAGFGHIQKMWEGLLPLAMICGLLGPVVAVLYFVLTCRELKRLMQQQPA